MFNQMTLQSRILAAFAFMGLLVITIALIGWNANSRLTTHVNLIGNIAFPSVVNLWKINEGKTQIQEVERVLINARISQQVKQEEIVSMNELWDKIETSLKDYTAIQRDSEEEKNYQFFLKNWERWVTAYKEVLRLYEDFEKYGIPNPVQFQLDSLLQGRENSSEIAAAKAATIALDKLINYTFNQETPAFAAAEESLVQLLAYNERLATEAIKQANQDVSQSTFWVVLGMAIGPITAAIFGIYFSISITRPVKQSAIKITSSSTQIAASGKQLEAMMTEQVASTNEVVATAKEIAATSGQLVQTMDEVTEMAAATTTAAGSGQKDIQRMEVTMQQLANATSSIAGKLGVISEKAHNINGVVITITKVADRTNLLSLNAAIEAEKAGEYGLGFAVVAREIRRLADQTAVATLDIEQIVKEMQSAVSTGVMEMDKFTKEVGRSVEDVRNLSGQLAEIISQVRALSPRFEEVNQGMESQSVGAQQISEAMVQLSEASSQTSESLREINGAIAQLNEAAQGLRREVLALK